ncbi:Thiamine repressible genes regulatory protein thi1 [Colletotrichum siamense]|uniref:Thiamine repressible genes regulatory protein thi1 n=1 Tax=Colletotrichum siamense TaxID=690259 RepID=UPI001873156A|nr:Thiamine repressible genes regulatory protein thi1 [Colletotrichum siamense]KAF5516577.1 Thiamine repressible genes regulatory protein thi1 [Colletotrichum siamense]
MDQVKVERAEVEPRPAAFRSCDWCRSRKIRCDKGSPCTSCKVSKVSCERKLQLKHRTQAQRVLISPEYRAKIDRIDERLDKITQILMDLKQQTKIPIKQEMLSPGPRPHPLLAPKNDRKGLSSGLSSAHQEALGTQSDQKRAHRPNNALHCSGNAYGMT